MNELEKFRIEMKYRHVCKAIVHYFKALNTVQYLKPLINSAIPSTTFVFHLLMSQMPFICTVVTSQDVNMNYRLFTHNNIAASESQQKNGMFKNCTPSR